MSKAGLNMPSAFVPEAPPTCVRVTKEQAQGFTIGQKVNILVSGEVQAIRKRYGDPKEKNNYDLEIKDAKVSDESEEEAKESNPIDNRGV